MITKTLRIHYLKNALASNTMSYNDIASYYRNYNIEKSLRQIQRDLKELEGCLDANCKLITTFNNKEKYFFIEKTRNLSTNDKESLSIIMNTNFYEPYFLKEDEEKINLLKKAINEGKTIKISKIINDVTGDNAYFDSHKSPITPIKLIQHRNSYYLGGYLTKRKKIAFFDIKQLVDIKILNKKGNSELLIDKMNDELKKRFGITKNINNKIYTIKIEIAPVLVTFIKNNHWHISQKIKKEKSKNYLYLTCGINRELIGWLFQWMYNVKIVEPEILKEYYSKSIKKMIENHQSTPPLVYRNIFIDNETS